MVVNFLRLISWPQSSHLLPDNVISYSLVPTEVQHLISYYHLDIPIIIQFVEIE